MKRLLALPLAAALVALPLPAFAQAGHISLSVDCSGSNESISIANNTDQPVTVLSVSSLHEPGTDEPFPVGQTVAPGAIASYSFGAGTHGNRLADQSILTAGVDGEGARVETSAGPVEALCQAGIGSRELRAGPDRMIVPELPTNSPTEGTFSAVSASQLAATGANGAGERAPAATETGAAPMAAPDATRLPRGGGLSFAGVSLAGLASLLLGLGLRRSRSA